MSPHQFDAWLRDPGRPPLVMGVLNVTPDSFSDGGRFHGPDAAVARAEAMAAEGADLIDVGGESTRPGSLPVEPAEQVRRVVPVLAALRNRGLNVTFSVDTTRSEVAAAALDAGAHVINDVSAGRDDAGTFRLAARGKSPIVLMHMQGTPATMQVNPTYSDVAAEVAAFLRERAQAAVAAGVAPEKVLLDPGIGFGKNLSHNLELLRRLRELTALGPLVVGTSRKGFIGNVLGLSDPDRRVFGTAATVAWSVSNGAAVVRVHDVGPMSQVVRMVRAIQIRPAAGDGNADGRGGTPGP
jgi:dihydropteroate synthase